MPRHVFVSYSRQDRDYVKLLVGHLRDAGIDVWIDESLEPGTPIWVKSIEQAIENCVALIPVMTTHSAESVWVDREIDLAQELGKPIFPLLVTGRRFMRLRDIQTEDATAGGMPSATFLASLAKAAGAQVRVPARAPTPAPARSAGLNPTVFRLLGSGSGSAQTLAWSPDGRMLATAGNSHTAHVWDVQAATIRFTLERLDVGMLHVVWSPDGSRLATIHKDSTICTWDAETGREIKQIRSTEKMFGIQYPVRWSPDGTWLAVGGLGSVYFIAPGRIQSLQWNAQLPSDMDGALWVAWSPDGKKLAASTINNVFVYDVASRTFVLDIDQKTAGTVMSVEWSPDGSTLITSNADSTITMWKSSTGKLVRMLNGHSKDVLWAGYSPDGKLIASCGGDGTFRLWDAALGTPLYRNDVTDHQQGTMSRLWSGDKNRVIAGAWSPNGEYIATSSNDSSVRIWSLR